MTQAARKTESGAVDPTPASGAGPALAVDSAPAAGPPPVVDGGGGERDAGGRGRGVLAGWLRSPFFWATVLGLAAVTLMRPFLRHVPDPPPVLGQLPEFVLTDQTGGAFGSAQLRGEVWVADFFFTSCPSVCPGLTRAMRTLSERFAAEDVPVHLVSFSVDPENDTPAVLADYAREYALNLDRWHLLTGDLEAMTAIVAGGFATHMGEKGGGEKSGGEKTGGEKTGSQGLMDIAHSTHFVLVDGQGRVRGYYGSDEQGVDEVFHRAQHVLQERREDR